jgi:hypothetical protein
MGRPIYDLNSFTINLNPLISCRVHVELSGRVKIASPIGKPNQSLLDQYNKLVELQGDETYLDLRQIEIIQKDLKSLMEQEDL